MEDNNSFVNTDTSGNDIFDDFTAKDNVRVKVPANFSAINKVRYRRIVKDIHEHVKEFTSDIREHVDFAYAEDMLTGAFNVLGSLDMTVVRVGNVDYFQTPTSVRIKAYCKVTQNTIDEIKERSILGQENSQYIVAENLEKVLNKSFCEFDYYVVDSRKACLNRISYIVPDFSGHVDNWVFKDNRYGMQAEPKQIKDSTVVLRLSIPLTRAGIHEHRCVFKPGNAYSSGRGNIYSSSCIICGRNASTDLGGLQPVETSIIMPEEHECFSNDHTYSEYLTTDDYNRHVTIHTCTCKICGKKRVIKHNCTDSLARNSEDTYAIAKKRWEEQHNTKS